MKLLLMAGGVSIAIFLCVLFAAGFDLPGVEDPPVATVTAPAAPQ